MNIQRQPQVLAMLERRQLVPTTTYADMLPAYQHRSCGALCPSRSWYQLILLGGQRHVHVNNLPKIVTW